MPQSASRAVRHKLFVLAVLLSLDVQPVKAATWSMLNRSDREATRLFAVVLAREPRAGRCQYDQTWDEEAIPDYIAKREFDLSVVAGLTAPSQRGDFRTIIDSGDAIASGSFCSSEELKLYAAQRVAEFEKSSDQDMHIDRTLFSYPIFNLRRTKAVIVVEHVTLEGRFRWKGKVGRHPGEMSSEAVLFKKMRGRWSYVSSTLIGIS